MHNFRFFWKGICFSYVISTLWPWAKLLEDSSFLVDPYDPHPNFWERFNLQWLKSKALHCLFLKVYFWKIFLQLRCGVFLDQTSILVFAKLANFHSIWIEMSLGNFLLGKSLGTRYDTWYMLFGICPHMSCRPKF